MIYEEPSRLSSEGLYLVARNNPAFRSKLVDIFLEKEKPLKERHPKKILCLFEIIDSDIRSQTKLFPELYDWSFDPLFQNHSNYHTVLHALTQASYSLRNPDLEQEFRDYRNSTAPIVGRWCDLQDV